MDLGDLKITVKNSKKYKSSYIEYLNLNKSLSKKSIKSLSNYFDEIFSLSETLFKSILNFIKKIRVLVTKPLQELKPWAH